MTNRGRIVTLLAERRADIQQAEVYHSLLAQRRAELCDHLDEQAVKLAWYDSKRDCVQARRTRKQIKEIGTDIREIDRMVHALRVGLLEEQQQRRSV